MDYARTAQEIYEHIGRKENIVSAVHCATRLRLIVSDENMIDREYLETIQGVRGVFITDGQIQIIFGPDTVKSVYQEFVKLSDISGKTKTEVRNAAAKSASLLMRLTKMLNDVFVPIIPAIVASGFMMGIMEALNMMAANGFIDMSPDGSMFTFAKMFSNTAFTFLPVLVAGSAARVFGINPFLGAVIGMIMIHPDLQNAWTVATEGVRSTQEVWFGMYSIEMVGYQGHVIPVIIAVWIMSKIENFLHKIVPEAYELFIIPLVSVFTTGYITLSVVGPIFMALENRLLDGVQWLVSLPSGIGSLIMGGLYSLTVVAGVHHMYVLIDMGQIARFGVTYWLPLASAANVAQGGAAFAAALKSRNKKLRSMAVTSSITACLGITEPAIFGVNLRCRRAFLAAAAGGAVGALTASLTGLGATGVGVTGIFGILLCLHRPLAYILSFMVSFGTAFVLSWLFGGTLQDEEENEILQSNKINVNEWLREHSQNKKKNV